MSTIINATTTNGVVIQPDNSGSLVLQTNSGTTALTIDTSQRAAFVAGTAALPAITTTGDTNTGMWFPAADTIAFSEGGTEAMRLDSSGNVFVGSTATQNGATGVVYSKTTAKAWVTFAGGTGTISSSFNVSSVTRGSAGVYTVTFTSAMPNANYSSFYMAQPTVSNAGADTFTSNPTTTTVILTHWEAGVQRDSSYSCFVAFGSA
jgi:hypothetical protein